MRDWKTTLTAIVTTGAYLLAAWGFELDHSVQEAIVVLGMFFIGIFARDTKKPEA